MAHTISTLKRVRQNEKRRRRNRAVLTTLRSRIRAVTEAVAKKDGEAARKALPDAYQSLDRAAARGVIHSNAAARKKSRLTAGVLALGASAKS